MCKEKRYLVWWGICHNFISWNLRSLIAKHICNNHHLQPFIVFHFSTISTYGIINVLDDFGRKFIFPLRIKILFISNWNIFDGSQYLIKFNHKFFLISIFRLTITLYIFISYYSCKIELVLYVKNGQVFCLIREH